MRNLEKGFSRRFCSYGRTSNRPNAIVDRPCAKSHGDEGEQTALDSLPSTIVDQEMGCPNESVVHVRPVASDLWRTIASMGIEKQQFCIDYSRQLN